MTALAFIFEERNNCTNIFINQDLRFFHILFSAPDEDKKNETETVDCEKITDIVFDETKNSNLSQGYQLFAMIAKHCD